MDDIQEIGINEKIDELELSMMACPPVNCPLIHKFVPGMYIREIIMPAGTLITSMIHKTKHPYFVMQGKVSVYSENFGEQFIEAPYYGITLPDTRRVLYIHENCVWITCHKTNIQPKDETEESILEAVGLIEDEILDKRENPLLGGRIKNNVIYKTIEQ